ncbi:MAG TPA: ribosome maturation factor RimM [Thermomicrobiales bacterium]|nr:ribosome maturation factor RimM [Thermomicrobiales bacterium]
MPASTSKDSPEQPTAPRRRGAPVAPRKQAAAAPAELPRAPQRRPPKPSGPLIESPGPDPQTPLDQIFLTIGVVVGTHGIGGDLKVRPVTDAPQQFEALSSVFLGDEARPRKVQQVRFHSGQILLKLRGIGNPEDAATFRSQPIRISGKDAIPLEEGEFLLYQLIGLEAFDEVGTKIGTTVDLIETGARDVFVIRPEDGGPEILLPNTENAVLEIVPAERRMVVRLLEYL